MSGVNFSEKPSKEILWAVEKSKKDLVIKLLESDPTLIHSVDNDGYTPLHRACYNNDTEIVDLLLSYGADVTAKTEFEWEPLHSACQWNNYECAAKLLQYGANVNAKSNGGIIYFFYFCYSDHLLHFSLILRLIRASSILIFQSFVEISYTFFFLSWKCHRYINYVHCFSEQLLLL